MLINYETKLILLLFCWKNCVCKFEGNVVGGFLAKIESYPHSASLTIQCPSINSVTWICGSSILTQRVLLTAAHCLEDCAPPIILATVGNIDRENGLKHIAVISYTHKNYDTIKMNDDLALIGLLKNLVFNDKVKRVIILKHPSLHGTGSVAGWGVIQEINEKIFSNKLKQTTQEIFTRKECLNHLSSLPKGTFCAGKLREKYGYTSIGDSGNALVINKVVQIGIVSYKIPMMKRSLSVYTDVAYHYNWIKQNTIRIHCTAVSISKRLKKKSKG